jgi:hypothetical protein
VRNSRLVGLNLVHGSRLKAKCSNAFGHFVLKDAVWVRSSPLTAHAVTIPNACEKPVCFRQPCLRELFLRKNEVECLQVSEQRLPRSPSAETKAESHSDLHRIDQ